ncbi:MAG: hypothetical protein FDZ69_12000 [Deltaproteobacteria bacterium]|nr:MAG: hypothetical protein FDZ69_12000 [Deltaproteobacteria bacterium]
MQLWPQARRRPRVLREGYTFSLLENSTDTYHFSVLAGMQRTRRVFTDFARALPDEAFFILEFYTSEPTDSDGEAPVPVVHYSPYLPVGEILETLEPYWDRLLNDGFVGFGIASNWASQELFYSEEKLLTCFTDHHIRFMDQLARAGVPHRPELLLHTDLGHDHLSLLCLERANLPASLRGYSDRDLDYATFCRELLELFGMYPVEESLSFFFSRREQALIDELLRAHPEFADYAEEDFGALLLDWNDFVTECGTRFEGDLWEYRQGLRLRDMIQYVIASTPEPLCTRIGQALLEPDERFRQNLTDRRKRLDAPQPAPSAEDHFWYNGVIRHAGVDLRRDLIRHGWYKP